jgi:hypothetical protein
MRPNPQPRYHRVFVPLKFSDFFLSIKQFAKTGDYIAALCGHSISNSARW